MMSRTKLPAPPSGLASELLLLALIDSARVAEPASNPVRTQVRAAVALRFGRFTDGRGNIEDVGKRSDNRPAPGLPTGSPSRRCPSAGRRRVRLVGKDADGVHILRRSGRKRPGRGGPASAAGRGQADHRRADLDAARARTCRSLASTSKSRAARAPATSDGGARRPARARLQRCAISRLATSQGLGDATARGAPRPEQRRDAAVAPRGRATVKLSARCSARSARRVAACSVAPRRR